jgi:hypothetical protein
MKSSPFFYYFFIAIFLVSCGSGGTPAPTATDTATIEPTMTRTLVPSLTTTPTKAIDTATHQPSLTRTPTPVASETASPEVAGGDCTQGWTQLNVGGYAKVAGAVNDPPNRVRSSPKKTSNNTIAQIPPGTIVHLIRGPVCADNLVFWKIEEDSLPAGTGWTAEGDGQGYWLEPYTPVAETVRLSAYGVNFNVPESWSNIPDAESVGAGSDGYFCSWPDYIKITLTTYPAKSEWKPMIFVYQTDQNPNWFPLCEGVPMLKVHKVSLSRGDRFVFGSTNAQPIFNSELIYLYKGVTPDGTHTVWTFFPVNFPLLAYSFQNLALPAGGIPFDINSQNWDDYYQAMGAQLEEAGNAEFTPSLDILDAIVESISVTTP